MCSLIYTLVLYLFPDKFSFHFFSMKFEILPQVLTVNFYSFDVDMFIKLTEHVMYVAICIGRWVSVLYLLFIVSEILHLLPIILGGLHLFSIISRVFAFALINSSFEHMWQHIWNDDVMMKHQLVELVSTKLMKANSRDYNKKIQISRKKNKRKNL